MNENIEEKIRDIEKKIDFYLKNETRPVKGEIFEFQTMIKNINELTNIIIRLNGYTYRDFSPILLNIDEISKSIGRQESGILRIAFTFKK